MGHTTDVRRLVINADDLGFTAGVNRGILEAHRAGVVTSASMMVTTPGFDDARRAVAAAPALGIGLHLNLVHGRPLARVPSLVDSRTGEFHPLGALARRAVTGRISPRDVRAETQAQIARLRDAGIAITHLDGHRHAHALPGLWNPIVDVALSAGIDVVRWPAESMRIRSIERGAALKKLLLRGALAVARRGRVRTTDHFAGISLQGGTAGAAGLLALLDGLRPGTTELMVHVGHVDPELTALDGYTVPRERELAALTSPEVRARLARADLQLIHFGQL